jgi:hypothetical protein
MSLSRFYPASVGATALRFPLGNDPRAPPISDFSRLKQFRAIVTACAPLGVRRRHRRHARAEAIHPARLRSKIKVSVVGS